MKTLSELKLLAQGGQADIYIIDENKVIRVLRNADEGDYLKMEFSVMEILKSKGKPVPKVYECVEIEGRPAIIMERLYGDSMLDFIKKNPIKLFQQGKQLAKLHIETSELVDDFNIVSINKRAASLIPMADLLDDELKAFVLKILEQLPLKNHICHGDFHPGNIIWSKDKYVVIDWFGVTIGDKMSDIAHTYLLLRNTPKLPHISWIEKIIMGCSGKLISRKYLFAIKKLYDFDWGDFSKWMIVRASERVFYGMPSEKEELINYIKTCKNAYEQGIEPSKWWKYI